MRKPQPRAAEAFSNPSKAKPTARLLAPRGWRGLGFGLIFPEAPEQPAPLLGLRFGRFLSRFGFAADQLDQGHLGSIAAARAEFEYSSVAARSFGKARGDFVEQFVDRRNAGSTRRTRALIAAVRRAVGITSVEVSCRLSPQMQ